MRNEFEMNNLYFNQSKRLLLGDQWKWTISNKKRYWSIIATILAKMTKSCDKLFGFMRCYWRMLAMECVGDKLVIHQHLFLAPASASCPQQQAATVVVSVVSSPSSHFNKSLFVNIFLLCERFKRMMMNLDRYTWNRCKFLQSGMTLTVRYGTKRNEMDGKRDE